MPFKTKASIREAKLAKRNYATSQYLTPTYPAPLNTKTPDEEPSVAPSDISKYWVLVKQGVTTPKEVLSFVRTKYIDPSHQYPEAWRAAMLESSVQSMEKREEERKRRKLKKSRQEKEPIQSSNRTK